MQISRHWRMNANRYRLEGFALPNGAKTLQQRQTAAAKVEAEAKSDERKTQEQRALNAA